MGKEEHGEKNYKEKFEAMHEKYKSLYHQMEIVRNEVKNLLPKKMEDGSAFNDMWLFEGEYNGYIRHMFSHAEWILEKYKYENGDN